MGNPRICFFGLSDNFHRFFIGVSNAIKARGGEPWFLNFWPGQEKQLVMNGMAGRMMHWRAAMPDRPVRISPALGKQLLRLDPHYQCLPTHQKTDARRRMLRAAGYLAPMLEQLFRRYRISAVFQWNGYHFPGPLVSQICRQRGIATLYGENGFFPKTLQIDPEGVNADSSLARRTPEQWRAGWSPWPEQQESPPIEGGHFLPKAVLETTRLQKLHSLLQVHTLEQRYYGKLYRPNPLDKVRELRRTNQVKAQRPTTANTKLPEQFLFVPLQVHDDTQITIHSPWIRNMRELVSAVIAARNQLKLPHTVVVKEHPVDLGRIDYKEFIAKADAVWLWDYPLEELLERAAAVITVNSSVGLEAVLAGRAVVSLGASVYEKAGVTCPARSPETLRAAISRALSGERDEVLRYQFLQALRCREMLSVSWGKPTEEGVRSAAERILQLIESQQQKVKR